MSRYSRKRMDSLPLHRVAILRPYAQFLADVGAPVERGFQRVGLPYGVLEKVDSYVPSHRFYAFLTDMVRREGIEGLGLHVGQKFGADNIDPKMSRLLRQSSTLYQGILKACEFGNGSVSQIKMGILLPPHSSNAFLYIHPSCGAVNPVVRHIGWFSVQTLIGIVREFSGPHWLPAEIGLMMPNEPRRDIRERFPGVRLRVSQSCFYIIVPKARLSIPPLNFDAAEIAFTFEHTSDDLVGSLRQTLRSYVEERDLNIEFAAEMCLTSKRSLQRKLRNAGTRYSKVLDLARFDVASQMLQDPDMKVLDVAHRLRYSDPAHFSRAFRRIAGVNPREYRMAHIH